MSCYNTERRLDELRRCGCPQCHREYDQILYSRRRDYYDRPIPRYDPSITSIGREMILGIDMVKPSNVEIIEPKDLAIKLIFDRFKAEQVKLNSAEGSIKATKATLSNYNKSKSEAQKNLKELGAALKKLGYKEETK